MDTVSGPLVSTIETVWSGIPGRHPDLPDVVVAVASGSAGRGRTPKRGTSAPTDGYATVYGCPSCSTAVRDWLPVRVSLSPCCYARPPTDSPETRAIPDTSSDGRYHNSRYRALAEELGLVVARHQRSGLPLTTIPGTTGRTYHGEINLLATAIVAHRRPESTPATPTARRPKQTWARTVATAATPSVAGIATASR